MVRFWYDDLVQCGGSFVVNSSDEMMAARRGEYREISAQVQRQATRFDGENTQARTRTKHAVGVCVC